MKKTQKRKTTLQALQLLCNVDSPQEGPEEEAVEEPALRLVQTSFPAQKMAEDEDHQSSR